jgi:hypothetical protein
LTEALFMDPNTFVILACHLRMLACMHDISSFSPIKNVDIIYI